MHWNPGAKHLPNKLDNIESDINGYKHQTSNPKKLSEVHSYFYVSSDHTVIIETRYTKSIVRQPRYVKNVAIKTLNLMNS